MNRPPQAIILAGPNGAGKTTTASDLLPIGIKFVNADMIAQELSGVPGTAGDINAGRLLLEQLEALVSHRDDFAVETTLSSLTLAKRISSWKGRGYEIDLVFVWLPSPDMSVQRVAGRVLLGGHHVPEETVRRRYDSGLRNLFRIYMKLADSWRIRDNSSPAGPRDIVTYNAGEGIKVWEPTTWEQIQREWNH